MNNPFKQYGDGDKQISSSDLNDRSEVLSKLANASTIFDGVEGSSGSGGTSFSIPPAIDRSPWQFNVVGQLASIRNGSWVRNHTSVPVVTGTYANLTDGSSLTIAYKPTVDCYFITDQNIFSSGDNCVYMYLSGGEATPAGQLNPTGIYFGAVDAINVPTSIFPASSSLQYNDVRRVGSFEYSTSSAASSKIQSYISRNIEDSIPKLVESHQVTNVFISGGQLLLEKSPMWVYDTTVHTLSTELTTIARLSAC